MSSSSPSGIHRREFLKTAAAAAGAQTIVCNASAPTEGAASSAAIIDVNAYLSHWPFRRVPCDTTDELVAKLRRGGVVQAWVSSLDGLLHKNLAAVNARLAEECRRTGGDFLLPFGSINPMQPDWEQNLRHCAETHRMPGIRLHPNLHGYRLNDPVVARLLQAGVRRRLIVQVALSMEDPRTAHPLVRTSPVDPAPLQRLVAETPGLRLGLLNVPTSQVAALGRLLSAGDICLDIAMLEGVAGIEMLMRRWPHCRPCFGSFAPYFCFESARLKLEESVLTDNHLRAIRMANADRLLRSSASW